MGNLCRRITGIKGLFILLALTLFLIGCGAGRTMVLAPPVITAKFTSAEIYEDKATVDVPADVSASFQEKFSQLLYGEAGFVRGPDLKIRYRFIQFNPGSQFSRWFWGGIGSAGKGTMTVEARFLDKNDNELAKIQSEGEITSGVFGGSLQLAIEKAAKEVAEYAKKFL